MDMDRVWQKVSAIPGDFWSVLGQMSPYLLFGFAAAGALSLLISARTVERHLGGPGFWPVFKAALFGVPLPLCSCGVIPVSASLHRKGASRGATVAFLISTPQTGVDSIMVTFSLLGLTLAIYRPVAALISGVLGGLLVAYTVKDRGATDPKAAPSGTTTACPTCAAPQAAEDDRPKGWLARLRAAVVYGFVDLPEDIGRSMLAGLIIAAIITAIVPPDFFTGVLSGGVVAMLVMMALGIPMYVCATASVPIAAALIAKGVSPGVALVFLMTGPATNAATIATIWRTMGKMTAVLYLASVAGTALASGLTLDYFFPAAGVMPHQHGHDMSAMPLSPTETAMAIILLAVLIVGAVRSYLPRHKHVASPKDILAMETNPSIELRIGGMTCSHCRMAVERALAEVPGSEAVDVDLHAGRAVVAGAAGPEELVKAVESIGYTAEVIPNVPGDQTA
jgi:uncharacterized membrane protein YraQ (UPF0718 family)/copper chaperone CopZ